MNVPVRCLAARRSPPHVVRCPVGLRLECGPLCRASWPRRDPSVGNGSYIPLSSPIVNARCPVDLVRRRRFPGNGEWHRRRSGCPPPGARKTCFEPLEEMVVVVVGICRSAVCPQFIVTMKPPLSHFQSAESTCSPFASSREGVDRIRNRALDVCRVRPCFVGC
jgi:hypothetical protein